MVQLALFLLGVPGRVLAAARPGPRQLLQILQVVPVSGMAHLSNPGPLGLPERWPWHQWPCTQTATPEAANIWALTAPASGAGVPAGTVGLTAGPTPQSVGTAAAVQWGTLVPVAGAAPVPATVDPSCSGTAGSTGGNAVSPTGAAVAGDAEVRQLRAHYEWQVRRQDEELRALQQRMGRLEQCRAEVKERWERERQGLVREISRYAAVLTRYAIPLEEACEGVSPEQPWTSLDSSWKGDHISASNGRSGTLRRGGTGSTGAGRGTVANTPMGGLVGSGGASGAGVLAGIGGCGTAGGTGGAAGGAVAAVGGGVSGAASNEGLDAKMRRLNGLLSEAGDGSRADRSSAGDNEGGSPLGAGSIASTLQAMFPHATVRTQAADAAEEPESKTGRAPPENSSGPASSTSPTQEAIALLGDGEVGQLATELERTTRSQIDDRALRALQSLSTPEAVEVLRKVDDLIRAQGGRCRNLSSILQSVCRKLERRSSGRSGNSAADGGRSGTSGGTAGVHLGDHHSSEQVPAQKVRDGSGSEGGDSGLEEAGDAGRNAPRESRSRRAKARKRRDHDDSDAQEDEAEGIGGAGPDDNAAVEATDGVNNSEAGSSSAEKDPVRGSENLDPRDYWTARRVERTAQRGFDMRWRDDHWELKLTMGGLDPPLSEAGMERYCRWLRTRLSAIREEHGSQALRRCCGEVDFSNNALSNQSVWMLLESLAQYEVHAASLKLFKNRISQAGVLAICEFIRANKRAAAVHEMHLSHNEIDDESAHELLRTLQEQRPRYPPRRPVEGAEEGTTALVPVWVRLNHNRIRDPSTVLRAFEVEGITFCAARNAHSCGPGKCSKPECPLAHLYLFADQAPRRRERDGRDAFRDGTSGGAPVAGGTADNASTADTHHSPSGSRRKRGRKSRHRDQRAPSEEGTAVSSKDRSEATGEGKGTPTAPRSA